MISTQPASPFDYRDHRTLALTGLNLWENHGWMVWDRVHGQEILLWLSPYRIVGTHPDGPFAVHDVALSQTMVVKGIYEGADRLQMHDNPFLEAGYELGDHLNGDALQVEIDKTQATWKIGQRRFVAAPPVWQITGSHADVDVDLTLETTGPPIWLTDPAKTIEESQDRWFLLFARARGTVVLGGQTLTIDGYAAHERHVHCGTRYNPIRLLSARGITFHCLATKDTQVIMCSRPSLGLTWARVISEGRIVDFSAPLHECNVTEVDSWVDPQSRIQVPCRWHSRLQGPSGWLEVTGHAFCRGYYLWPHFKFGCTVLYWWLGEAELNYELTSGERGHFSGLQYVVHDNRLLYRQHRDD
jgi:hypothetical protein